MTSHDTRRQVLQRTQPVIPERYREIMDILEHAAQYGKTTHELARIMSKRQGREIQAHHISGRITELTKSGAIADSQIYPKRTVDGVTGTVHVIARFAKPASYPPPPRMPETGSFKGDGLPSSEFKGDGLQNENPRDTGEQMALFDTGGLSSRSDRFRR